MLEGDQASAYAARKTDAYAMFTKAPLATGLRAALERVGRRLWRLADDRGNAVTGSNDATSRISAPPSAPTIGFSPNTIAGFALAGGGTNFSVNNRHRAIDLFQAGAYSGTPTARPIVTARSPMAGRTSPPIAP